MRRDNLSFEKLHTNRSAATSARLAVVALLALPWLAGCPQPTDDGPPAMPPVMPPVLPPPTAELGFTDPFVDTYRVVPDGDTMPMYTGGQGGSHIYATLRATGFPAATDGTTSIQLAQTATMTSTGAVLNDFTQTVSFAPLGNGMAEMKSRFVFLDDLPDHLDGQTIHVVFVLSSAADPTRTARIEETIALDLQQ